MASEMGGNDVAKAVELDVEQGMAVRKSKEAWAALRPKYPTAGGLVAAATVIGSWGTSLVFLVTREVTTFEWWVVPAMLWMAFLYTGLFITAHDAMHGTVAPKFPRLNKAIGVFCVVAFALFDFRKMTRSHWAHHDHPASAEDPDYHDGEHDGMVRWFLHFMLGYVTIGQIVGMALIFNALQYLVGVAAVNMVLFWIVPSLLSTVQLFYFGTVLPHRETEEAFEDEHRARSNDFGPWLSFLTCYHFGYHWEHHDRPDLPWWHLPAYRKQVTSKSRS